MMNIKRENSRGWIIAIFCAALAIVSCSDKAEQKTLDDEIKQIDNYVSSLSSSGQTVITNGLAVRIIMKEGDGETVENGDSLYFNYAGYIFSNGLGTIFDTNLDSLSSKLGIDVYNRGFNAGNVLVKSGELLEGLVRGLTGAKEGEYSYIVFPSSLGFGNVEVGVVPAMSPLIFEIWIKNVVKK